MFPLMLTVLNKDYSTPIIIPAKDSYLSIRENIPS